jgi:hypothetical protein
MSSSTRQYLVTTKHKGAVFCPLQTGLDLNALEWSPRANYEERIRSSHIGRVAIGGPCAIGVGEERKNWISRHVRNFQSINLPGNNWYRFAYLKM